MEQKGKGTGLCKEGARGAGPSRRVGAEKRAVPAAARRGREVAGVCRGVRAETGEGGCAEPEERYGTGSSAVGKVTLAFQVAEQCAAIN